MSKFFEPCDFVFAIQGIADHRKCHACALKGPGFDGTPTGYLRGADGKHYPCPACHGTEMEDHGVLFVVREVQIVKRYHVVGLRTENSKRVTTQTWYLCRIPGGPGFEITVNGLFRSRSIAQDMIDYHLKNKKNLQPYEGLGIWRERA